MPIASLTSWKSVAEYLGRGVRTVQRWHSEEGLPVRHVGGGRGTVFAYPEELDTWLKGRAVSTTNLTEEADDILLVYKRQSLDLTAAARQMRDLLTENNLSTVARVYRKALDLDPNNAEAYAGVADALVVSALLGHARSGNVYASAETAVRQAQAIDSNSLETQCAAAWLMMMTDANRPAARAQFDSVLRRCPEFRFALIGRALAAVVEGHLSEGSDYLRKACEQNTLGGVATALLCWVKYLACDFEEVLVLAAGARAGGYCGALMAGIEALASIQIAHPHESGRHLEICMTEFPGHPLLQGVLGYAHATANQPEEARRILFELTTGNKYAGSDISYPAALIMLGLNEMKQAASWLAKSCTEVSIWSLGLRHDPLFAVLNSDSLYEAQVRRIGIASNGSFAEPDAVAWEETSDRES